MIYYSLGSIPRYLPIWLHRHIIGYLGCYAASLRLLRIRRDGTEIRCTLCRDIPLSSSSRAPDCIGTQRPNASMKGRLSHSSDDGDSFPPYDASAGDRTRVNQHIVESITQGRINATARATKRHTTTSYPPSNNRNTATHTCRDYARGPEADSGRFVQKSLSPSGSANHLPTVTPDHDSTTKLDEHIDIVHRKATLLLPFQPRSRLLVPCSTSILVVISALAGIAMLGAIMSSSWSLQLDVKGCRMSYMRPSYIHMKEFDTEHTRFASKYSLHLYREQGIDDGRRVSPIHHFRPTIWTNLVDSTMAASRRACLVHSRQRW